MVTEGCRRPVQLVGPVYRCLSRANAEDWPYKATAAGILPETRRTDMQLYTSHPFHVRLSPGAGNVNPSTPPPTSSTPKTPMSSLIIPSHTTLLSGSANATSPSRQHSLVIGWHVWTVRTGRCKIPSGTTGCASGERAWERGGRSGSICVFNRG